MAELVLLNLNRIEYTRLYQRATQQHDPDAAEALRHLWDEVDKELECFVCSALVERPIWSQILPDINDDQLIAAPLCGKCRELPGNLRQSRSLRVLKRMLSARTGKNVTFNFNLHYRQPHPR
jgi:hypothetical protein